MWWTLGPWIIHNYICIHIRNTDCAYPRAGDTHAMDLDCKAGGEDYIRRSLSGRCALAIGAGGGVVRLWAVGGARGRDDSC